MNPKTIELTKLVADRNNNSMCCCDQQEAPIEENQKLVRFETSQGLSTDALTPINSQICVSGSRLEARDDTIDCAAASNFEVTTFSSEYLTALFLKYFEGSNEQARQFNYTIQNVRY